MKILFAGYRDERHSKFGGYDYIAAFPNSIYLNACDVPFGFIPVGKRGKGINLRFLYLKSMLMKSRFDVVHYFYGDFMLFGKLPRKGNTKFFTTIHMRSKDFSEKKLEILRQFDGVISLSSSEKKNLESHGVKAYFIPHGFNKPSYKKVDYAGFDDSRINIFYSGTNYRDFDMFLKAVEYCKSSKQNIHFYAVGQSAENKLKLACHENVTVCKRLDDDEYYSLLNSCDYNFLPLTFATANNALLESQAFGKISILPDIDGIQDYADHNNNLLYKNFESLAKILDSVRKESTCSDLMLFAQKFSWNEIYKILEDIYNGKE